MEEFFRIKIIVDYIIPVTILGIIICIVIVSSIASSIRKSQIKKFFESNGYTLKLTGVSSVGNGAFYSWVRESDNKRVVVLELRGMSLKEIKDKYKE